MYRRHYIKNGENTVLFLPDSLRFFQVNELTQNIIEDVCKIDRSQVLKKYGIDKLEYDLLIQVLGKKCEVNDAPRNKLNRLTLIISGICNLRCKYCYAHNGMYRDNIGNMSIDILKQSLDVFCSEYDEIENIMFFGGEPLLNIDAIKNGCEYVHDKYEKGDIKSLPVLGLVTNGTILTDEFIELVKKYNMKVTVSLDGPPIVNDRLRVYEDGKGSSLIVENNILKLKKECNQPEIIEATYTTVHEKLGMSVVDVVKYLKDKFDVSNIHISPESSFGYSELEDASILPFIESIDDVHKMKKAGCDYRFLSYNSTLEGLKNKQISQHYCEAGLSKFSVSPNGDVYPCHLFTGENDVKMGNIEDANLFTSEKWCNMQKTLINFSKYKKDGCAECYSNTLCRQCIAENYYANGDFFTVLKKNCEFTMSKTENIIGNIAMGQTAT